MKYRIYILNTVNSQNDIILFDLYDILGPEYVSDYDCLYPNIKGQEKVVQNLLRF